MKRSEIQNKAMGSGDSLKGWIQNDPLKAGGIILIAGIVIGLLKGFFLPLLLIAGVAVGAIWMLAEDETKFAANEKSDSSDEKSDDSA